VSAVISGVVLPSKKSLKTMSLFETVAAAKPESARTPGPTVNGPLRTSHAASVPGTSPSNGVVVTARGCFALDLAVEK
jgi:hypothetical protein